jgi:DNA-binding MarR family transcriptional regulator
MRAAAGVRRLGGRALGGRGRPEPLKRHGLGLAAHDPSGGVVTAGTRTSMSGSALSRACIVSSVNDIAAGRAVRVRPGESAAAAQATAATQAVAADLFAAISMIRRAARRAARQAWTRQPLPPAQSELLRLAAARPGITVADAAQELRLAPNTVSTLVGRLTDAGLLSRERGPQDARTALLTVTDKATKRIAEFRDLRAELAASALARLPARDQQMLASAAPALLRLAELMESS